MNRFKISLLATAGILILAFVLTAVGPKRVMAALGYTPVRDVDQPARQPFVGDSVINLKQGSFDGSGVVGSSVPLGKRLVIDKITALAELPSGQRPAVSVTTRVGTSQEYFIPLRFVDTVQSTDAFDALESGPLFSDPGNSVTASAFRSASAGSGFVIVRISGHLIDLP